MTTLPNILSAKLRTVISTKFHTVLSTKFPNVLSNKLRVISSTMRRSVQLLTAASGQCLICGNSDNRPRHPSFPSLCMTCFQQIPWITQIECHVCGRPEYCPDCSRRTDAAFIWNRSAVRYNALIREWLALYKYRGHEALAPILGKMLVAAYNGLIKSLDSQHSLRHQSQQIIDAIVPVPVSRERLAEREFNQAERLGACLAENVGIPLHNVMERTRHSGKQSYKTRGARLRDTHNLFTADPALTAAMLSSLNQARIGLIIVDDIYTTGSTANACATALVEEIQRQRPAVIVELYILTVARS